MPSPNPSALSLSLVLTLSPLLPLAANATPGAPADAMVLLPVPSDPTISFSIAFKVGSQHDPAGKEGLAFLTAALIAEGSTTANSYPAILDQLYPLASGYDVRVDKEMTTLTGRTHKDNLEVFFKLLTDAYLRPAFNASDFSRLKDEQLNALKKRLRYASDEELGKAALYEALFAGTGYRHPRIGTVAGVEAITLDDVRKFYATYFTAGNAILGLGGGYSSDLVERFRATLQQLPPGAPAPLAPPRPAALTGRQVVLVHKPDADASISLGFPLAVKRGERDFYALWLANSWLGEHRNSAGHLYQVIREDRGLNYGNYSYIEAFPEGGQRQMPPTNVVRRQQIFEIWLRTLPNDNALFALRAALHELQKLVDTGMSEAAFAQTQAFLSKYYLHFAETTEERLGYAIDDRFYGIPQPGHLAQFRQMITSLTRDEVNQALKKHLRYENMVIAIVTGQPAVLQQALATGAPSPPRYATPKSEQILAEDQEIIGFPLGVADSAIRVVPVEEIFSR